MTMMEIGAKIESTGDMPRALVEALQGCEAAITQFNESQITATKKAEIAHAEILTEMRQNQAEILGEIRASKAELKEQIRQSEFVILDEQFESNLKIGDGINATRDLVIRASLDKALSTPLRLQSPQSTTKGPLIISVSLESGDPIKDFAHHKTPIAVGLDNAHDVAKIIKHINHFYGRPAQNDSGPNSKQFNLFCITAIDELKELDAVPMFDSSAWVVWVQKKLMHKKDQVKADFVFKLGDDRQQISKKRKVNSGDEGKMARGDEMDGGRNCFRAFDW